MSRSSKCAFSISLGERKGGISITTFIHKEEYYWHTQFCMHVFRLCVGIQWEWNVHWWLSILEAVSLSFLCMCVFIFLPPSSSLIFSIQFSCRSFFSSFLFLHHMKKRCLPLFASQSIVFSPHPRTHETGRDINIPTRESLCSSPRWMFLPLCLLLCYPWKRSQPTCECIVCVFEGNRGVVSLLPLFMPTPFRFSPKCFLYQ